MIDGLEVNIASQSLDSVGVVDCQTCAGRPCRHGGICRASASDTGYDCTCQRAYSGLTCQLNGRWFFTIIKNSRIVLQSLPVQGGMYSMYTEA